MHTTTVENWTRCLVPTFISVKPGAKRKVGYVTPPDLLDIEALLLDPTF